jgi:hypothetical protein
MIEEKLKTTKIATLLDREDGGFGLDYDNTLGKKNTMRLEARTYERALAEAKSFLGIGEDNCDDDGNMWEIE